MEEWKEIVGYDGMYEVSDAGRIRSWWIPSNSSQRFLRANIYHIIKPVKHTNGYYFVSLCSSDGTRKERSIHRIVAETFIPNPNNCPEVNHKNGDKYDNCVNNLEWVTSKENKEHAKQNNLLKRPNNARRVLRSDGQIFNSAAEAGRALGFINGSHVSSICNGKRHQTGGYTFVYIDD